MNLNAIKRELARGCRSLPVWWVEKSAVWWLGVVVFVWWGSAGRGSGWVRNMYDDLLRLTPTFCDVFIR